MIIQSFLSCFSYSIFLFSLTRLALPSVILCKNNENRRDVYSMWNQLQKKKKGA